MTRIAHLSDLHFLGVEEGAPVALLDALRRIEPDLVVISGDLTMSGKRREFEAARNFLERIEQPRIVVPGNHDIPANPWFRFVRPLARYRASIERDLEPSVVTPEMCVLGLNTARPWDLTWNWSHGRFSTAQVEAADRFFESHPKSPFKCLVMHHPFFLPEGGLKGFRIVGRSEEMLRVLIRRRVDIVLAGHLHRGFWSAHEETVEDTRTHVLVAQASTATSLRTRGEPNAFNVIEVEADGLTLTPWTREQGAAAFERRVPTRFARGPEGWSSLRERWPKGKGPKGK